MSADPFDDQTTPYEVGDGFALAQRAREGDGAPFIAWLTRNPAHAKAVAEFLALDEEGLRAFVPPPGPTRDGTAPGGYELREVIGKGAMGVVYKAFDPVLKREVAVKMIRAGEALSATESMRFRFEAEVVASLDHVNIVPILAFGESNGDPYLVMPLMNGSLADQLKARGPDRRYTPDDAAKLVIAISLGVHHTHQLGLIHRDLKPGNVLLDKDGVPKIADFGLARLVGMTASIAGGVAGTFAYMAPEQARGERPLTITIDVHALGAILFELLTGGVPYRGDVASVLRKLTDPHERASVVSDHRPDVPADLEAICQKCLERDPNHRYTNARELADDLERFRRGEAVLVRPRGLRDEFREVVTRPAEVQSYITLPSVWFATVHHPAVHLTIMGLVLAGAAPVWSFGVMMYHLAAWLGQAWWFSLRKFGRLNQAERKAAAFNLGNCLAVVLLLPLHLTFFGTNVMPLYPILNVVTGLGFLQTGGIFAGRQYVLALLVLSLNLLLPFLPMWTWPLIHALIGFVFFGLFGLHLRRVHKEAETARSRLETAVPA